MKCTDKTGRTDNLSKPDGYTAREWARVQTQEAAEKKKQFRLLLITVLLAALTALMVFLVYYLSSVLTIILFFIPTKMGIPYSAPAAVSLPETLPALAKISV